MELWSWNGIIIMKWNCSESLKLLSRTTLLNLFGIASLTNARKGWELNPCPKLYQKNFFILQQCTRGWQGGLLRLARAKALARLARGYAPGLLYLAIVPTRGHYWDGGDYLISERLSVNRAGKSFAILVAKLFPGWWVTLEVG